MSTAAQIATTEHQDIGNFFGGIQVKAAKIIDLVNGLPGFEELHNFILSELQDYAPFCALQSVEEPEISMLVINAKLLPIWKGIEIPPRELQILDIEKTSDSEQFIILKINQRTQEFTGNIKAPIVFNQKTGVANQVILDNASLSVEYPMKNEIS